VMAATWILYYAVFRDGTTLLTCEAAFSKNDGVTTRPPGSTTRSGWSSYAFRSHFEEAWDLTPAGAIDKFIRSQQQQANYARQTAATRDAHVRAAEQLRETLHLTQT
jgi:hypothetical protein